MNKNIRFGKALVSGIIVLFVGAAITPNIVIGNGLLPMSTTMNKEDIKYSNNEVRIFSEQINSNLDEQSNMDFIAIDMAQISLPSTRGIDPTPFIVLHDPIEMIYLTWIMTIDDLTGMQLGDRLEVYLPSPHIPVGILWATHFLQTGVRGIDPEPFILFRDSELYTFPVSYGPDGTPTADDPIAYYLPIETGIYGDPTCLAEMPGSEFIDGEPRLIVGTEWGFVIVLILYMGIEVRVDAIIPISGEPVIDLEPIPQYGYISLGVVAENKIFGIDLGSEMHNSKSSTRYSQVYVLSNPRPTELTDIDIFGVTDEPLNDPDDMVHLVLADGTEELALSEISAMQMGSQTLSLTLDPTAYPIKSIASGSLLMLQTDGSTVFYDPAYSEESGSGNCQVIITDDIGDNCSFLCGDVTNDGVVDVGDVVFLVNYLYRGGEEPKPALCIGDVQVPPDGVVNVGDVVYIINYLFRGGEPPTTECCL